MKTKIEQLKDLIINGVHSERPDIEECGNYISVDTEIWSPDIYTLDSIEEIGFIFCGMLDGKYIFSF